MSMMRKLFRPGGGAKHERYVAAFNNGTDTYRGDLVHWDHTAPTDQGSSGVLEGATLTGTDFIFVRHAAATTEAGLQAGVCVGDDVHGLLETNTTALANCAATTGEFTYLAAYAATATNVADGALAAVSLTADTADWVRGTATAEERTTAFIRCDF
jgi:hypothetical protein